MLLLDLLLIQGVLGGFDTIYHHELKEQLPYRTGTERELRIHGARSLIYAVVFGGLAWFAWGGLLALAFAALFAAEIWLTLWDFLVEDSTRKLPASERVTHTVLAINGGVFLALLVPVLLAWWQLPTDFVLLDHGWRAIVLSVFAAGLIASGLRDLHAARRLAAIPRAVPGVDFGALPLRVLVTGGTGFIGQRLVWTLLDNGHHVTLYARNPAKAWTMFRGKVEIIKDLDGLTVKHEFDAIINLAGEPVVGLPWTKTRKADLLASRITTTRALARFIEFAEHKPRVMISGSAVGYYGNRGDEPLGEDSAGQAIFMSRLCAEWEAAAFAAEHHGVRVCVMRLGLVFGWGGALPLLVAPHLLGLGARFGNGAQWVSWVHIDDVIGVTGLLVRSAARGIFNVTAPAPLPQADFARHIGRMFHRPVWLAVPAAPLNLVMGEMAEIFTRGQRVLPRRLLELGYRFRFITVHEALENFRGEDRDEKR